MIANPPVSADANATLPAFGDIQRMIMFRAVAVENRSPLVRINTRSAENSPAQISMMPENQK